MPSPGYEADRVRVLTSLGGGFPLRSPRIRDSTNLRGSLVTVPGLTFIFSFTRPWTFLKLLRLPTHGSSTVARRFAPVSLSLSLGAFRKVYPHRQSKLRWCCYIATASNLYVGRSYRKASCDVSEPSVNSCGQMTVQAQAYRRRDRG